MVDVGVDFGSDRGARNVGVSPGARHQVRGSWVFPGCFPGRDSRCAEYGCSPDEDVYYALDNYCIISA